jgi:flap endonuclease-1
MDYDQFVDLCILCGCDYADTIDGIGPVTAFKLIKNHGSLEKVMEHLKEENKIKDKYRIPTTYPYETIREIFKNPEVDRNI